VVVPVLWDGLVGLAVGAVALGVLTLGKRLWALRG
jgi:hypothetical protein